MEGHFSWDDYGDLGPCRRAVDAYWEALSVTEPIAQIDVTCAH
jgi:hypothetical protein